MIIVWGVVYHYHNWKNSLNYDEMNQSRYTLIESIGFENSDTLEELPFVLNVYHLRAMPSAHSRYYTFDREIFNIGCLDFFDETFSWIKWKQKKESFKKLSWLYEPMLAEDEALRGFQAVRDRSLRPRFFSHASLDS